MNKNYNDEDLQRTKEVVAMDMKAKASRSHARTRPSRTQRELPADTEHGIDDSDDELTKSNSEPTWESMRNYMGMGVLK